MEIFAQYLDDLEDLLFAFALLWERIRERLRFALFVFLSLAMQILGVMLALAEPPVALAVAAVMLVGMLLHGALHPPVASARPA